MTDPAVTNMEADATRFAVIYAENRSRVYAFAVSKAGRQLAEEILSEVFMIAWRRFGELPEPPLPWLLAVTRNVAMSQSRTQARDRSLAAEMGEWVADAQSSVGDIADDVAERVAVLTALAALAEPDRELLTLVAWHDLSPKAAAQVIGCSTAAYFVRLHRARRRLETALAVAGAEASAEAEPTAARQEPVR
ncbi:MAG TPA: sigma-70 family RNA polymerase sigma factor [Streptosporangiaceae bacterium]|nr:sigma-70 family RNA polymerase sigma factor [Streptosporangiaceae bacterium]